MDKTSPTDTDTIRILQLADLHFIDTADAKRWCSQLAADLTTELKCDRIDAVVIAGDVGNRGELKTYEAAGAFMKELCKEFKIPEQARIIVPGNHDYSRDLSIDAYVLTNLKTFEGELKEGEYVDLKNGSGLVRKNGSYESRFSYFADFYMKATGKTYPARHADQWVAYPLDPLNLIILGFNSAWMLDHINTKKVSIHLDALTGALNYVRSEPRFEHYVKTGGLAPSFEQ